MYEFIIDTPIRLGNFLGHFKFSLDGSARSLQFPSLDFEHDKHGLHFILEKLLRQFTQNNNKQLSLKLTRTPSSDVTTFKHIYRGKLRPLAMPLEWHSLDGRQHMDQNFCNKGTSSQQYWWLRNPPNSEKSIVRDIEVGWHSWGRWCYSRQGIYLLTIIENTGNKET